MSDPDVIEAAARLLGPTVERDAPLGALTTYRVGGPAALLHRLDADDDLEPLVAAVSGTGVDVLVVGRGSNLLVADAGFPGLAVVLGEGFAGIEVEGSTVRVGAAASLPVVARRTVAAGLTGFEWAVGVTVKIQDIDNLQDEMMDMMDMSNEIHRLKFQYFRLLQYDGRR